MDPTGLNNEIIKYREEQVYTKADAVASDICQFIQEPPVFHWLVDLGIDITESLFSISIKPPSIPDVKAGDIRETYTIVERQDNKDITLTSQTTYYLYSQNETLTQGSDQTTLKFIETRDGMNYYWSNFIEKEISEEAFFKLIERNGATKIDD